MAPDHPRRQGHGLLIFDGSVPQARPSGFRNVEYNAYLDLLPDAHLVTTCAGLPNDDFSIGKPVDAFEADLAGYLASYPQHAGRFTLHRPGDTYSAKLAYTVFLNETWTVLETIEASGLPFVFCLYPGGGFFVNDPQSDAKLRRICASPCFRKVLATQRMTCSYLLHKEICRAEDIAFHYGGFVQYLPGDVRPRLHYPADKDTFDIAFVAARYMPRGVNKGYDLFLDTARLLADRRDDMRFHVVGNWDRAEIDVSDLGDRVVFHGFLGADELADLYATMDILLTPNRPLVFKSQFDGFPLGIDAGYCGVAVFTADEIRMNQNYVAGEDLVSISLVPAEIAATVERYYLDPASLISVARRGQARFQALFDRAAQIDARLELFESVAGRLRPR